jgi:hypothetical protein
MRCATDGTEHIPVTGWMSHMSVQRIASGNRYIAGVYDSPSLTDTNSMKYRPLMSATN